MTTELFLDLGSDNYVWIRQDKEKPLQNETPLAAKKKVTAAESVKLDNLRPQVSTCSFPDWTEM